MDKRDLPAPAVAGGADADAGEGADSTVHSLVDVAELASALMRQLNSTRDSPLLELRTEVSSGITELKAAVAALQGGFSTTQDEMSDVKKALSSVRDDITDVKRQLARVNQDFAGVKRSLREVNQDLALLRGRVSDMDSLSRTHERAGRYVVAPLASDVAPRGVGFREGDADLRPRSPFAQ